MDDQTMRWNPDGEGKCDDNYAYDDDYDEEGSQWWTCTRCGAELPGLAHARPATVRCPRCGLRYRFDYWALNRWKGDGGTTGLEPRPFL